MTKCEVCKEYFTGFAWQKICVDCREIIDYINREKKVNAYLKANPEPKEMEK